MMLQELTSLRGVSGFEDEVRQFIIDQATPLADEVRVDTLGNVIVIKKGATHPEKTVMVTAHMDEVGFIITGIEEKGTLRFATVAAWMRGYCSPNGC
jgi:endoglucanase